VHLFVYNKYRMLRCDAGYSGTSSQMFRGNILPLTWDLKKQQLTEEISRADEIVLLRVATVRTLNPIFYASGNSGVLQQSLSIPTKLVINYVFFARTISSWICIHFLLPFTVFFLVIHLVSKSPPFRPISQPKCSRYHPLQVSLRYCKAIMD
jgi:hypothetical protein